MELVVIVVAVLLFEVAAARWGYDSRGLLRPFDKYGPFDSPDD
ncbi:MAG TPA: hypothetical protein VGJ60_01015 [Chloroflexota bacterium]|jgi:hypothetical protein